MKNFLDDILSTVKFKSAVYFQHGFCGPWGMEVPKGSFSQFHIVTNGSCYLMVDEKTVHLERGDIVVFPNGAPHQIKDHPQSVCRSGMEVMTTILEGKKPFEGEEVTTRLICGHYEMDRELNHPVFEKLPKYIILRSSEYGRFDLIYSVFELILEEMRMKKAGYESVSLRLAEVLYISIIRHYYMHQSPEKANLLKDKLIYQAVDMIHKTLDVNWNIEKLAREVGVSRTLFIERFKNAVGQTPMKYIMNWRLTKAKYLLANTDLPLSRVGEQIGYPSETSFNRAFKQKYAVSPGKFRIQKRQEAQCSQEPSH